MTATVVRLAFANGKYPFRLGGGEIRELQRVCDAGPMEIHRRLLSGTWRIDDVTETLRQGLLGAARKGEFGEVSDAPVPVLKPTDAAHLINEYVMTYAAPFLDPDGESSVPAGISLPWAYSALLAAQVVAAGLMGSKDEPLGKKQAGEEPSAPPSPTESSDGALSSPGSPTEE